MEDLILAIEALSVKSWIDCFLVIVPIVISILAVIISIYTTRKQNKIALFEMKYKIISQIRLIEAFNNCIKKADNVEVILSTFDACFEMDLCNQSEYIKYNQNDIRIKINSRLKILQNNILMAEFFLEDGYRSAVGELMIELSAIVNEASAGEFDVDKIKEFNDRYDDFKKKYLNTLINDTKC